MSELVKLSAKLLEKTCHNECQDPIRAGNAARCAGTMAMGIERLRKTTSEQATNREPPVFNQHYALTRDQSQRVLYHHKLPGRGLQDDKRTADHERTCRRWF